jgi:hypothetical protein
MKKQTAVEWYENEMNTLIEKYESKEISKSDFIVMRHNLFYSAKAMEKEQIDDAYVECYMNHVGNGESILGEANRYYNETYGGDK